ncbi:MAG: glycosyltransferase [Saprospiraceae bacterium]|nr:glycosyltransferase [Saprospiraceae bacterium]
MVSIILPFFQVAALAFDEAIRSMAEQSLQDWELILVDNNADAATREIAEKWAKQEARIRIIHEPVQGIAFALNRGLQEARYNLIARMDADDFSQPQRLERQVAYLMAHPEIGVVATQTTFESELDQSEGYDWFVQWQNGIISPEAHARTMFIESPVAHPTVMFRKSLIEDYGPYSTENVPEDYELWLRWCDAGVQFYKLPEPLLVWKDHPQRLSRTHNNYSTEAFWKVKCQYLAAWIRRNADPDKKIVVCGAGKLPRLRAKLLEAQGISIYGYTDVKARQPDGIHFIPLKKLIVPKAWLLLCFISKRGVGEAVAQHFTALGFEEGKDFLIC